MRPLQLCPHLPDRLELTAAHSDTDIRVDPTRRPISVMRFGSAKDSSPTAASMVTGGHDSILRLYDFRMPSATPALTYSLSPALTSPITALAVSPTSALHVVLGLENGTIGWVDWRRTGRLVNRKFSAHGEGGVMTLDWKDGGRGGGDGWIASGGLDRKIHVSPSLRRESRVRRDLRADLQAYATLGLEHGRFVTPAASHPPLRSTRRRGPMASWP